MVARKEVNSIDTAKKPRANAITVTLTWKILLWESIFEKV